MPLGQTSSRHGSPARLQRQAGVSCFELLFVLFPVVCAVVLGIYLGGKQGWPYGILGALLGFGFGAILFYPLFLPFRMLVWWQPHLPVCRRGICKDSWSDDRNGYPDRKVEGEGLMVVCRCGDRYLKSGKRFMEVLPDGSVRPYMKHRPFGRWQRDEPEARR